MAVSLEARVPLLDVDLIDYAMRIPGNLGVTSTESKRLFRKAIKGIVPDWVLTRPKMGFAIPLQSWFRGALRHHVEALRSVSPDLKKFVDQSAVTRLVFEHLVGRRDHSVTLWRLMVLNHWLVALRAGRLGQPPAAPPLRAADA